MREIEIKFKVNGFEEIEKKLAAHGYVLSDPIHQHDTIYSLGGNFGNAKEGDIMMRIRRLGSVAEFSAKVQRSRALDNLEYETEVKNPEAMHQILLTLGFRPVVEVKKMRKKGKLGEYEICLDEVEKLGSFIELEKLTDDDANPDDVRAELFIAIEPFGFLPKDEEIRPYDTQIEQLSTSNTKRGT